MQAHDEDQVRAFWADAQTRAHFNPIRAYTGPTAQESLPPPVLAFGADDETADTLLELVLERKKTATASAVRDFEAAGEELPAAGTMAIVTDSTGSPRALIETTDVRVVPFAEVDAEHAAAEAEGDGSLDHWRRAHRVFFSESAGGASVTEEMPVVLERFRVLHQA